MNSNLAKTLNYLKKNGLKETLYAIKERLEEKKKPPYVFIPVGEEEKASERIAGESFTTSISILVPTYETKEAFLRELIDSVIEQTYGNWELILADASGSDVVSKVVAQYKDKRIKYHKLLQNGGISENSNAALSFCTGDYIGLLDHDDVLTKDALFKMTERIIQGEKAGKKIRFLYSDEDKMDSEGRVFFEPNIKPDFNLDLLLSNNYICHFLVMKADFLKELSFDKEYDGAQDHDLLLRAVSSLKNSFGSEYKEYISHIDRVLYHWRSHELSTAANPKSKQYAYESGKRAVEAFVKRERYNASVENLPHMGFFYIDYRPDIFENRPEVGAVGRKIVEGSKIVGGLFDEDGNIMFEGMNRHLSGGPLHRAVCLMEVPYVDIRSMIPSVYAKPVLDELLKEFRPVSEKDYKALSIKFGNIMKQKGYIFVHDPKDTVKKKNVKNYSGNT